MKIILILLPAIFSACSTIMNGGEYRYKTDITGYSVDTAISPEKIAGEATYQIFFNLAKDENCIKIVIKSKIRKETLKSPHTLEVNAYFIIERIIDINRYKIDKKTVLYEMGRNFDSRWNSSHTIVLCEDTLDPLKKFNPGLYRIRLSSLQSPDFLYTIEIHSRNEAARFGF